MEAIMPVDIEILFLRVLIKVKLEESKLVKIYKPKEELKISNTKKAYPNQEKCQS
jgi:hypothetical protein